MTSPIKKTMQCYLNVMVGTGWLRVGLVSQPGMRSFDVADKEGETLTEEALWGPEVRGHPATAAAARARGRRQKKGKTGGGQEAARVLHNRSLSLHPRYGWCCDADLTGKCSTM